MIRPTSALRTCAAALLLSALAPALARAQAQLTSDSPSYLPGQTARFSGSGFAPSETVTMLVAREDGSPATGSAHQTWSVVADAAGGFTTDWQVCGEDCVDHMLVASATGDLSGSSGGAEFFNHDCGTGVVTSVVPVGGACSAFTPAVGNGPDNYEVQQGGTYVMTIEGVTECTGNTITVFVQSSSTGNFCFNATGGNGTYVGTFTMPNPACNTMPVSYKCGANATCNHPGSFGASGPHTGCGGVHLRASNFNSSCVKTSSDTDCSGGGCTPCTLVCPPDVTVECDESTDPSNTGTPTGCASATYEDEVTQGSCTGSYVITRTWSAPNGCDGTVTCQQVITVTDTTAPEITCPPDVTIVGCCLSPDIGMPTASDDCSEVALTNDAPSQFCQTTVVTWTATDECGNSSSCEQTVTVVPCELVCPPDVTIDCSESTDPSNTGTPTGCSGATYQDAINRGACADYVITRTWSAPDGCGGTATCEQIITVTDTTPPEITCPDDVTVVGCCLSPDIGTPTAFDDCSGVSLSNDAPAQFCETTVVTWTATDACGNSSSCEQTVTVVPCEIVCPPDVSIDCGDSTDPSNTGTPTGCTTASFEDEVTPGDCAGEYVITRTWTAADGCSTSSCEQIITVTDTTPPTITCPPDATFTGCCTSPDIGSPTVGDDCSDVVVTNDAPAEFCLGTTVVTWTATDECGNSSQCQQLVTIEDVTLDFETDGVGAGLLHGQSLATAGPEAPYPCVTITGGPDTVTPGDGNNGAAVFDSTNGPFGQDPDLNVGLGNILYLQSNGGPTDLFTGVNGPDTWDHPNDDEDGGTLTFDFCTGVQAISIDLIDIDLPAPTQAASVVLTDGNGKTRTYTVPAGWTANGPGAAAVGNLLLNSVAPQPGVGATATASTQAGFDETDVVRIQVRFGSSGACDNLRYCPSGPEAAVVARNGSGANPMNLTPNGMPVLGSQWSASLDCTPFRGGLATLAVRSSAVTGAMTPAGETLIGGELVHRTVAPYARGASQLRWTIPYDMSLIGLEVHVQGLCLETGGVGPKIRQNRAQLSNALDLTLGF